MIEYACASDLEEPLDGPLVDTTPFAPHRDRVAVTHEPDGDQDWIGTANQGGGSVPADYAWRSNPKQEHDQESSG